MNAKLTTTTTVTKEVKLQPSVRRTLLNELKTYASLKDQRDALDRAMDDHKAKIAAIREKTGENAIELDGFKTQIISPTRSKLNKMKLVELGCAAAWIEEATEIVPTRPYEKITCPGERPSDRREEQ